MSSLACRVESLGIGPGFRVVYSVSGSKVSLSYGSF